MKMLKQKLIGAHELEVGNNIVEVNVISEDSSASKIYKINVYRKSEGETEEYNRTQEENDEKIEEIFSNQILEVPYNTQKTSFTTVYYINNNEILKIIILASILFIIVIIVIRKKNK